MTFSKNILPINRNFYRRVHFRHSLKTFVPKHRPVTDQDIQELQQFVDSNKSLLIITGAGISTESGIPDYRSVDVGLYARSSNRPVQYKDFMHSEAVRKRYWARNFVGWPRFSSLQPNLSHKLLAKWEERGKLHWLVTQNVDRLHHKAGNQQVTELHGTSFIVKCTKCNYTLTRSDFQKVLIGLNNDIGLQNVEVRPDGDVELTGEIVNDFQVPECDRCKGILKPDVVFFGENVPMFRVNDVYEKVRNSTGVLVLGSSLEVYSAYRFLLATQEQKKPIAIVNIGQTRADQIASLKLDNCCSDILCKIKI